MKRIARKNIWVAVLVVVLVAQSVALGILWHDERQDVAVTRTAADTQDAELASLGNFVNYAHGVIAPGEKAVYLPELGLKLPLNAVSTELMYSVRPAFAEKTAGPEADITTQSAAAYAPATLQVKDCTSLVRIKFEAKPNPYSPSETALPGVTLSDGRVLQIYASHEPSCQKEWQFVGASPTAVADLFRDATVY